MRELSVVNLGILLLSVLHTGHFLAKEVEGFGWTMFSVREMKVPLWIVGTFHGVLITVVTPRMHLWCARVSMIFIYGEQLNWLFTEHGTTEVVKTRPVPIVLWTLWEIFRRFYQLRAIFSCSGQFWAKYKFRADIYIKHEKVKKATSAFTSTLWLQ